MRLYGKRYVKRGLEKGQDLRIETKDSVLWSIDEDNRICTVKIQGSDEEIVVHYPRNWSRAPNWLRPGNAVRIIFRSGRRGYAEVFGHGRAVPTSVEGPVTPPVDALGDAILTGCEVIATYPRGMQVDVTPGTFRLNDTIYALGGIEGSGILMLADSDVVMGDDPFYLGQYVGYVDIDPAPADGYYRYDIIVVGEDLVLDYVKGTAAKSDPQIPETPDDHLLLDWILIPYGTTEITDSLIGKLWTTPTQASIAITYTPDSSHTWPTPNPTSKQRITVRATLLDQYGNSYVGVSDATLTKLGGSGDFCDSPELVEEGYACESTTYSYYWQWTYERPSHASGPYQIDDAEYSVSFKVTTDTTPVIGAVGMIFLYDSSSVLLPFGDLS